MCRSFRYRGSSRRFHKVVAIVQRNIYAIRRPTEFVVIIVVVVNVRLAQKLGHIVVVDVAHTVLKVFYYRRQVLLSGIPKIGRFFDVPIVESLCLRRLGVAFDDKHVPGRSVIETAIASCKVARSSGNFVLVFVPVTLLSRSAPMSDPL